ncbi:MAG: hypothetical protein ACK4K6_18870 [Pseudarthrobacter sp.]
MKPSRDALQAMLDDLDSNRLDVILLPSRRYEVAIRGGMIRVVQATNPEWYRRLCADYPKRRSRPRNKRKPDTRIVRKTVRSILVNWIKTGRTRSMLKDDITRYAKEFEVPF